MGENILQTSAREVPSRGRQVGTGNGPSFQPIDIGHPEYLAVLEPGTAFWALVKREQLAEVALGSELIRAYRKKANQFAAEMHELRFGLKPAAVYFNPTERCNLNCSYCYIPEKMRRLGQHMSAEKLLEALAILKQYFSRDREQRTEDRGQNRQRDRRQRTEDRTEDRGQNRQRDRRQRTEDRTDGPLSSVPLSSVPSVPLSSVPLSSVLPQVIFHGAEPLLNRQAVFAGIEKYSGDFRFGIQTNATLLDDSALAFLREHEVSIGISLDAPTARVADRTRSTWTNQGVYLQTIEAMDRLRGYPAWSVIATITRANLRHLPRLVDFFHEHEVPTCLMNILRCTQPRSRAVKPDDLPAARSFLKALDRTHELFRKTGRKLIVGNFANILLAIMAPTARRLMCDISPCGGGRCFFALAPNGDLFPCSEFIGLKPFCGGNLFRDDIPAVLASAPFQLVTGRKVENIEPCNRCAIRHFCGSPCPAEAHEMNGGMNRIGAFCEFYEEQVRYAFRLIADEKANDFLWDGWDSDMEQAFDFS